MILQPRNDRVLVERLDEDRTTAGGLIIPDNAKEKPLKGTVIAVGPGKRVDGEINPIDVNPGDTVLFNKYSGAEITHEHKQCLILREDDILAVYK